MNRIPLLLAGAALLCACATNKAAQQSTASETAKAETDKKGFDLGALAARELDRLPKQPITIEEWALQAELESVAAPKIEREDNLVTITAPLGTESDLTCFIYPESVDAGSTIQKMIKAVAGSVQVQSVRTTDVVAVQENPAVFVALDYLVQSEQGALAGQLKMMVFAHPDHPLLCMEDEVGYSESFKRIALGLASSYKLAETQPVRFADLQVVRVNETPIGFTRVRVVDGENGEIVAESVSAQLMPRSATEVVSEDSVRTEVSDASGSVLGIAFAQVENGELSINLQARRTAGSEYEYQGVHGGKEISGTFKTSGAEGLLSDLRVSKALREELLTGKIAELAIEQYEPRGNPGATVQSVARRGKKGPRSVTIKDGDLTLEGTVDPQGWLERIETDAGQVKMLSERAFSRGTL